MCPYTKKCQKQVPPVVSWFTTPSCKPPFLYTVILFGRLSNHIYCLPGHGISMDLVNSRQDGIYSCLTHTPSTLKLGQALISINWVAIYPGPRDVGRLMPRAAPCVVHTLCLAQVFWDFNLAPGVRRISATRETSMQEISPNGHPIVNLDSWFGPRLESFVPTKGAINGHFP